MVGSNKFQFPIPPLLHSYSYDMIAWDFNANLHVAFAWLLAAPVVWCLTCHKLFLLLLYFTLYYDDGVYYLRGLTRFAHPSPIAVRACFSCSESKVPAEAMNNPKKHNLSLSSPTYILKSLVPANYGSNQRAIPYDPHNLRLTSKIFEK